MSTPHVPEAEVADRPVGHDGGKVEITERPAWSGGTGLAALALVAALTLLVGGTALTIWGGVRADSGETGVPFIILGILAILVAVILLPMIRVISPGHTHVVQFFGRYLGTNRHTGLSLVPPLATSKKVSVRVRNFETNQIKVNDLNGNPIMIGAIIVWQVADTAKATFSVEDVEEFIHSQSESALRHVATSHPYDGGTAHLPSLSGSTDLVSRELADEVAARVRIAGLEILEARISALSYAPRSPRRCCSASRRVPSSTPARPASTVPSPWSSPPSTSWRRSRSSISTPRVAPRWCPTCWSSCAPTPTPSR